MSQVGIVVIELTAANQRGCFIVAFSPFSLTFTDCQGNLIERFDDVEKG